MTRLKPSFIAITAFFLAGCATPAPIIQTVVQTKVVTPDVPAGLLTCMGAPPIPPMTMESQAMDLLVQEIIAGQDCRDHLAAVAQALSVPAPLSTKK
jgi:hypothetical protein